MANTEYSVSTHVRHSSQANKTEVNTLIDQTQTNSWKQTCLGQMDGK